MAKHIESVTILAASSKFESIATSEVCSLDQITKLVCDPPSGAIKAALLEAGINLIHFFQ